MKHAKPVKGHKLTTVSHKLAFNKHVTQGTCSCGQFNQRLKSRDLVRAAYRDHLREVTKAEAKPARRVVEAEIIEPEEPEPGVVLIGVVLIGGPGPGVFPLLPFLGDLDEDPGEAPPHWGDCDHSPCTGH